ncbi:MAG: 3-oxoacyl-ACP reductase [Desulfobulbaceae bacterium A2]|nr:MAG: 3-oxoacyl-ACP reductase [Desulfobulbaceae bacterium A2]
MEMRDGIALVAGASRGLGRALARFLAAEGARLVLPWYDWPEDCAELVQEFGGADSAHLTTRRDLRDPEQVRALAAEIAARYGRLSILINNIERGGMPVVHGPYERTVNREQWRLEWETTLGAKQLLFRHCLPLLRKSPQGAVVNISSIAGLVGRSGPAAQLFNDGYAAANRAVSSLTETWAREAAPNIRVNELMLGLFATRHAEGTRGWDLLTAAQQQALREHTLLERNGRLEEAVAAVRYLLREADFMTGAVLRLDGGYVLGQDRVPPMPPGIDLAEPEER